MLQGMAESIDGTGVDTQTQPQTLPQTQANVGAQVSKSELHIPAVSATADPGVDPAHGEMFYGYTDESKSAWFAPVSAPSRKV